MLTACSKAWPTAIIHTDSGDYKVKVEVASTESEKMKGLMFRTSLPEGEGMLFVYDRPLLPGFWMRNTLIPLDMLFIDADSKIVDIAHDQKPCLADACPTYTASAESQYVLEIPGGAARRNGVAVGDAVSLP